MRKICLFKLRNVKTIYRGNRTVHFLPLFLRCSIFQLLVLLGFQLHPVDVRRINIFGIVSIIEQNVKILMNEVCFVHNIEQLLGLILTELGFVAVHQMIDNFHQSRVQHGHVFDNASVDVDDDWIFGFKVSAEVKEELSGWEDAPDQVYDNVDPYDEVLF